MSLKFLCDVVQHMEPQSAHVYVSEGTKCFLLCVKCFIVHIFKQTLKQMNPESQCFYTVDSSQC